MEFTHFSRNGELLPLTEAIVPLSNIEYQYGFGVYESLRVVKGVPYFLDTHIERLLGSAHIIGLSHPFAPGAIGEAARALVRQAGSGTYNLKFLLVGGARPELYILPLNPHFPDKKLYRDGAHAVTVQHERLYPHAKTLNMLGSYLALMKAHAEGAWDALLVDEEGNITEGTRTNLFFMRGRQLVSPPEEKILLGVTRKIVLRLAAQPDFSVAERNVAWGDISTYDAAFLTSTSAGIMPLRSIDAHVFPPRPAALTELMREFEKHMDSCGGKMSN